MELLLAQFGTAHPIRLLVDFFMSILEVSLLFPHIFLQERSRAEVRSQVIAANNIVNAILWWYLFYF